MEELESLRGQLEALNGNESRYGRIQEVRNRMNELETNGEQGSQEYVELSNLIVLLEARAEALQNRIDELALVPEEARRRAIEKMQEGDGRQNELMGQIVADEQIREQAREDVATLSRLPGVENTTYYRPEIVDLRRTMENGEKSETGVRIIYEYNLKNNRWRDSIRGGTLGRSELGAEIRTILADPEIVAGLTPSERRRLEDLLDRVDSRGNVQQQEQGENQPEGREQPAGEDQQPEGENQQPEGENQQPEGENQQPEGENQQPEGENQQPEGENQQPEGENQQPEGENQQPEGGDQPEGENQQPEGANQQPAGGDQPAGENQQPTGGNQPMGEEQPTVEEEIDRIRTQIAGYEEDIDNLQNPNDEFGNVKDADEMRYDLATAASYQREIDTLNTRLAELESRVPERNEDSDIEEEEVTGEETPRRISKEIIRSRIEAYETTPEREARIAELRDQIISILDEHGLTTGAGIPDVVLGEGQRVEAEYEEEVTSLRNELRSLASERGTNISQRGLDVLPILRELLELGNESFIEFGEISRRLLTYRESFVPLDHNDPHRQFGERSEIDQERIRRMNPYIEMDDAQLQEALEQANRDYPFQERQQAENPGQADTFMQRYEQLQAEVERRRQQARERERLTNIINELESLENERENVVTAREEEEEQQPGGENPGGGVPEQETGGNPGGGAPEQETGENPDSGSSEQQGEEVVRKDEIRSRIDSYEKFSNPGREARIAELRDQIISILDEHGLTTEDGTPDVVPGEGQRVEAEYEEEVTGLRNELRSLAAERGDALSQRAEDVLPVLKELEQLENVPGLEFEAIYASEVDNRIARYREELDRLERNDPHKQFGERSEIDQERIRRMNPYIEMDDDQLLEALDQANRDYPFHERQQAENPGQADTFMQRYEQLQAEVERRRQQARERERLENIIDELESLQRERVNVQDRDEQDKDHQEPEQEETGNDGLGGGPGGEGPGGDAPGGEGPGGASGGGPEQEEPGQDQEPPEEGEKGEQPKKSPRHWVEIMAETQTQSSGSIPTYFHQMGKIQPFRMGLTIWAAPVKLAMKGVGKLFGDVMGRCQAKKNEMLQNLRELAQNNPEEFEILVNGLTETNMRQYKVNEIYLDAVQEVLTERENAKKQAAIDADNEIRQAIEMNDKEVSRIQEQLANPALTDEQKISLQTELERYNMVGAILRVHHEREYQIQIDADKRVTDFDRGKVGKSTRKMNIQGWLAGSFNPDNRELHQQEAALRKEQREAGDRGDTNQVLDAQRRIDELQEDNTHVIQLLEGTRFESRARINRGLHTVEEVHQRSNDADQTKARELIATAMAAVTFANMVQTYQANHAAQQQIDQHLQEYNDGTVKTANTQNAQLQSEIDRVNGQNAQVQQNIDAANAQNAQVQQSINAANSQNATVQGQIESARGMVSEQDITQAGIGEIHRNNAFTYASRHEEQFRFAEDPAGSRFNIGHSDEALHSAQAAWTQSRRAAEQSGDISQEVANSMQRAQQAASDVVQGATDFTSLAGKAGFTNSEYIQNLQNIMSSSPDSFTLLQKLFSTTKSIGDTAQVTGSVAQVSDSVAQVLGSTAEVAEIAPLVLETTGGTLTNVLPFIVAMGNLSQLEIKKAQMDQDRKTREEANKAQEKTAEKTEEHNNDGGER